MTQKALIDVLDLADKNGIWAFGIEFLRMYFPNETKASLNIAIKRHTDSGLLVNICRNFYANPRAKSMPANPLYSLPQLLRSSEQFYLSLETALSDCGLISQMPNRLVFMTSGRSQEFRTPYGIVEFVHSRRKLLSFYEHCEYDKNYGFYVANPKKAFRDAMRTGRSIDLIDKKELEHVQ